VVFRLTPPTSAGGSYTEDVLHAFTGGSDGAAPGGPLTLGASGELFGITAGGAGSGCAASQGCGLVFELKAPASGAAPWTESILYTFTGGLDGGESSSGLLLFPKFDLFGNRHFTAFGTTLVGGAAGNGGGTGSGTVFTMSLQPK
jgi:hypothetical protein